MKFLLKHAPLLLFLFVNSSSVAVGQSADFKELFDNAQHARAHLGKRLQVDFSVVYGRSGIGKVAVDGKAVDREVLDNIQEYGRLALDEDEGRRLIHFHRSTMNIRSKPHSDSDEIHEGELSFHALIDEEIGWYGLGGSSYSHRGEVRSETVPRSLGEMPFEILPYCDFTVLKTHGVRKARAVDYVSNATVISDETKDGKRELLLLYPNRMGGMRIILERWDDWRPLTVECFIGSPTNRIYPRDDDAVEAFRNEWQMHSRLSVDWGYKVVDGERKAVPLHLVAISPGPNGKVTQTMEATFCNWRFGKDVPDSTFSLTEFEKLGKKGVDFVSIRRGIIEAREALKEASDQ